MKKTETTQDAPMDELPIHHRKLDIKSFMRSKRVKTESTHFPSKDEEAPCPEFPPNSDFQVFFEEEAKEWTRLSRCLKKGREIVKDLIRSPGATTEFSNQPDEVTTLRAKINQMIEEKRQADLLFIEYHKKNKDQIDSLEKELEKARAQEGALKREIDLLRDSRKELVGTSQSLFGKMFPDKPSPTGWIHLFSFLKEALAQLERLWREGIFSGSRTTLAIIRSHYPEVDPMKLTDGYASSTSQEEIKALLESSQDFTQSLSEGSTFDPKVSARN